MRTSLLYLTGVLLLIEIPLLFWFLFGMRQIKSRLEEENPSLLRRFESAPVIAGGKSTDQQLLEFLLRQEEVADKGILLKCLRLRSVVTWLNIAVLSIAGLLIGDLYLG